ncbi:ras association domain-containing protein 10-like [Schistocerca piceifrons]|uniref:ras association domain-containing protein 10-like n=1 Tax=Schistocerca piceifrons TaxID=274613 RepID=UPI001F5F30E9|nr:ras association domain-containing protein 10-like [Schistocerca piceifrons]XP_047121807.1 ras association domain-containing protein 10-like [Schistocerca piceifrons]
MLKWQQQQPAHHQPGQGLQHQHQAARHRHPPHQQPMQPPAAPCSAAPAAAPARKTGPPSESSDAPSASSTTSAPITVRMPGADDCADARLPVWLGPRVVWVAGVGRRTTCDDVVEALGASPRDYVIAERWGRVERRLDGSSRLLKLWSAWGDAQGQVRLILRHADDVQQAANSSRRRSHHQHRSRPRSHHHHHHHRHQEQHPRGVERQQKEDEDGNTATVRRLLRLVLEQGETIAEQLARLGERDRQISSLELRTHRRRLKRLGSNYLLEAYLGSGAADSARADGTGSEAPPALGAAGAEDSGVVSDTSPAATSSGTADSPPVTHPRVPVDHDHDHDADLSDDAVSSDDSAVPDDLSERVELMERLVQLNRRLEREESALVRLTLQVRSLQSQQPQPRHEEPPAGGDELEVRRVLLERLEAASRQLERGRAELQSNESALASADAQLAERRHRLHLLESQLHLLDSSLDSNSDTGLSSLHSGSEEADALCPCPPCPPPPQLQLQPHPLDTLV